MLNAGLLLDLAQLDDDRRRGGRAVSHRVPADGAGHVSRRRGPHRILPARLRAGGASPGALPHPRYRRRQGAALSAACRRGQPGDGLARDPHRARPPGDAAPAIARADPCGRRAGRCSSNSRWSPRSPSSNAPAPWSIIELARAAREGRALPEVGQDRRHARGAVIAVAIAGAVPSGSISCRSAPTICCSFCSPAIAAIRAWPIATIRSRRRCWRCFAR